MRWCLPGLGVLVLSCLVVLADQPRPQAALAQADEVQDIVLLDQARPLLLRLHVRVDGQPFRSAYTAAWEDYVNHLFRHLDRNGDGVLNETEAVRLPPPLRLEGNVNIAFNFRALDADGDGTVTAREVQSYYNDFGGGPFQASFPSRPSGADDAVDEVLFTRLDTDRDGKLSMKELQAAASLFQLDLDQDELLTAQELLQEQSPPQPVVGTAMVFRPGSPSQSPFIVLESGVDRTALAARILERYNRPGMVGGLGREAIGLSRAAFERLDANRDGTLDAGELEKFPDDPADLEMLVRLGKTGPGEEPLEVLTSGAGVRRSGVGMLAVQMGKDLVELRCNAGSPRLVSASRNEYLPRFRSAAGGKGHLTAEDARRAGFFPTLFPLLDRDGDGRLTEAELLGYLDEIQERQARAVGRVVALRVSDEARGLFGLLDRNRDGRLGLREIRAAPGLLAQLGRAGALSREDIPHSSQLAVGLARAGFNRLAGGEPFSPPGMPFLALDWARPGLIWFQKMDRNHDGELSPREFLGTREHFRRLDADNDGLISLEEAERAEELFRKKN